MPKSLIRPIAAACALALCSNLAYAQRSNDISKSADALKAAFASVVAGAGACTVQIKSANHTVALGTVIDARGYILTKASLLAGDILVKLGDDKQLPARIINIREDLDLACLKIDATGLKAVTWADSAKIDVGQWVAACGMPDKPVVAVGIVSTPRRLIPKKFGILGVEAANPDDDVARIGAVVPATPADNIGLLAGDIITKLNGMDAGSFAHLRELLQRNEPYVAVTLTISRAGKELTLKTRLADPAASEGEQLFEGSISTPRASNFPAVIQHDTVLPASACGGPLVDLDGKVLGINIARAGRTETYTIPADLIKPILKSLMTPPPATKPASTTASTTKAQ